MTRFSLWTLQWLNCEENLGCKHVGFSKFNQSLHLQLHPCAPSSHVQIWSVTRRNAYLTACRGYGVIIPLRKWLVFGFMYFEVHPTQELGYIASHIPHQLRSIPSYTYRMMTPITTNYNCAFDGSMFPQNKLLSRMHLYLYIYIYIYI